MNYWQKLWRVEILAILSHLIFVVLLTAGLVAENLIQANPMIGVESVTVVSVSFALILGMPAVVAYGAPIYCIHATYPRFTFPAVLVASIVPGLAILLDGEAIGFPAIVGGLTVAVLTEVFAKRWPGLLVNGAT